MAKKLSEAAFATYLAEVKAQLTAVALVSSSKPINYGFQYVVQQGTAKATLNIYNGKKGLSLVWQGDSALQERLAAQLAKASGGQAGASVSAQREEVSQKADISVAAEKAALAGADESTVHEPGVAWAGSDESGKGDFFGPLVVAAVAVDDSTAGKLEAIGVKDCKLLTDNKILALEKQIEECVVDFAVLELKPKFYNWRYEQIMAQGGKLTQLLMSGHVEALTKVLARQPQVKSALIDQFTPSNKILQVLASRFPQVQFSQHPKAESDMAVAAASVLARARFLHTMESLSRAAGEELPKGGGAQTTACAHHLAQKFGKAALENFVKKHFVNYQRI